MVASNPSEVSARESGAVLLLVTVLISALVIMSAIAVDHSRQALALSNLENSSDAAALAAARMLDGTRAGWQNAKKAAVLALKKNPIHGTSDQERANLKLDSGPRNFWDDPKTAHPGISGTLEALEVTVERGIFRFDATANDGEGDYSFLTLEQESDDDPADGRVNGSAQSYLFANAVRISIALNGLKANLGHTFGVSTLPDLHRVAIAVSDGTQEVEVAPLAIPYCQLLLNANPHLLQGDHQLHSYDPQSQYLREIIFSDANPKRNLENWQGELLEPLLERRDGITRYESFIRPAIRDFGQSGARSLCYDEPVTGEQLSCKDTAIYATMAIPVDKAGKAASPSELRQAFEQARRGELVARAGMYAAPFEEIDQLNDSVGESIAEYINSGTRTVSEVFKRPASPYTSQWLANENFPFIRTRRPGVLSHDPENRIPEVDDSYTPPRENLFGELRLAWPSRAVDDAGRRVYHKVLLDHQTFSPATDTRQAGDWVNPLCHDSRIPLDADQARVKEVYAMVVAPGVDYRGDGKPARYCDFSNLFASKQEQATGILAESNPTIVGFVKVSVFDFNIDNLDARFAATAVSVSPYAIEATVTPQFGIPGTANFVYDRHPGELDVERSQILLKAKERTNSFKSDFKCFAENEEKCKRFETVEPEELFSESVLQCFDFAPFLEELSNIDDKIGDCFDDGEPDRDCLRELNADDQLFKKLESFYDKNIPAFPNTHCLPQLKLNTYNRLDPKNYNFGPRKAGCGCCGLRAKLSRMPDTSVSPTVWPSGRSHRGMSPTLVTDRAL